MLKKNDVVIQRGHPRLSAPFRVDSVGGDGTVAMVVKLHEPRKGCVLPVATDELELLGLRLADTIKVDLVHMLECPSLDEDMIAAELRSNTLGIKSFSDLHDVMDANTLGDTEMVWGMMEHIEHPPADYLPDVGREDAAVQFNCDVVNIAQNEVDRWIKLGGLITL